MALNFPNTPTHGDTHADSTSGITYRYNGIYGIWEVVYYVRPALGPAPPESELYMLDFRYSANSQFIVVF